MSSFRKNKIHSDFKLSDIKKLMFVCQSKKEPAKLFFTAEVNKGEARGNDLKFNLRFDSGKKKSGSRGYEPLYVEGH